MNHFVIEITTIPHPHLLDPQGEAVQEALHRLGFTQVDAVRVGKAFIITVSASTPAEALALAEASAQKLLHNPVVETFRLRLLEPIP